MDRGVLCWSGCKDSALALWAMRAPSRMVACACVAAVRVCVDARELDLSFAGRRYDEALLADLPAGVDPCGENGEFHTFVDAGPILEHPILCKIGPTTRRDG